ncbi:hypothetical protein TSAR_012734 [Trichomalopsis sarcophagae]|uniref:BZIP domain-containing protein n=1 Tax=Trichomalopsis sarcophagae TaxID=543379 RepID=A0A232FHG6_9HYME|nr:hypothetical protein TSAR_012734 [Trichomalopsis sarcophagae]
MDDQDDMVDANDPEQPQEPQGSGRKRQQDDDDTFVKPGTSRDSIKVQCTNKNALAARQNRERQKKHVEMIENKLHSYETQNKNFKTQVAQQKRFIEILNDQVAYLKWELYTKGPVRQMKEINENLIKIMMR